jgi:hypothetical protein
MEGAHIRNFGNSTLGETAEIEIIEKILFKNYKLCDLVNIYFIG